MLICIMLNGWMLEVGIEMWLFGLFDVACGTLKLALIDFFFYYEEIFHCAGCELL